jgi:HSP20 family protein
MSEQGTGVAVLAEVAQELKDDIVVVRAEVPGIDPGKDVEVTLDDDVLRIKAERRSETTAERDGSFSFDFHYGLFERAVRVPNETVVGDVKTSYKDGILEVTCPRKVSRVMPA